LRQKNNIFLTTYYAVSYTYTTSVSLGLRLASGWFCCLFDLTVPTGLIFIVYAWFTCDLQTSHVTQEHSSDILYVLYGTTNAIWHRYYFWHVWNKNCRPFRSTWIHPLFLVFYYPSDTSTTTFPLRPFFT